MGSRWTGDCRQVTECGPTADGGPIADGRWVVDKGADVSTIGVGLLALEIQKLLNSSGVILVQKSSSMVTP